MTTSAPLNIVHLEDDALDAELVQDALESDGIAVNIRQVATRDTFVEALAGEVDVILADYSVPGFDSIEAQMLAQRLQPEVPFLFVSGTLGEEVAIERMKAGARDYVLKQRLGRLPSAVRRALEDSRVRRERLHAEEALRQLNAELEARVQDRTLDLQAANAALTSTQVELRAARAFLEDLVAASPFMVFRLDPLTLRPTYMSPNVGWLLGFSADELVRGETTLPDLLHPSDRELLLQSVADAFERQVVQVDQECGVRSRDGQYRRMHCLLRFEYGTSERPVDVLGYALDITDRKAAEEALRISEARLSTILETVAEGILIITPAGETTYWNPAAERILQSDGANLGARRLETSDWIIGTPAGDPLPVDEWPVGRVLLTGQPIVAQEISFVRGDGTTIMLSVSAAPWRGVDSQITGVVTSFRDITERLRAERAVNEARREAERANRAKSEFLSRMSHDLRTPLNSILGFAQLLEVDSLSQSQLEATRQILSGGRHLLDLINEVLDIARIEAGQLSLSTEPVQLWEILDHAVKLVAPLAEERGVEIVLGDGVQSPRYVSADRQRLTQVLLNLLSNAIKYNRVAGTVTIACEQRDATQVRIRVSDTGAGIPPDKIALLFRPFERLGAEHTAVQGTGLGLALSKGLVEAMGGTMGVESVVDEGTSAWVQLEQTAPPAAQVAAGGGNAALTVDETVRGEVLYIEDNAANVRLIERVLARRPGVRLVAIASGRMGIERARTQPPDLILLDLHLPDVPGQEVLRALWEDPTTRPIPVAVLSADATPSQMKRLLAAGALTYLTKPLDLAALLRVIDDTLVRRRRTDSGLVAHGSNGPERRHNG